MARLKILKPVGLISLILLLQGVSILFAQAISYDGTGNWDEKELGNHRAVIEVLQDADAVWIHVPWRRKDNPENKAVIIVDASSGKQVENYYRLTVNKEYGDFIFLPSTGKGMYYLYYMPYKSTGSWYFPNTVYSDYSDHYDPNWQQTHQITSVTDASRFPAARVLRFESINAFNSFDPMEIIATKQEVKILEEQHANKDFLIFPEDRKNPIRMTTDIPKRWTTRKENEVFSGTALRNEFYVYQIGVFAAYKNLNNIQLLFSDLVKNDREKIRAASIRCFNLEGNNWLGESFTKNINIKKGQIQAFWIGIDITENASPGAYSGTVIVSSDGGGKRIVNIHLNITDKIIENKGYDDLFRMARLNWLDSKIGLDDRVFKPYVPVELNQHTVKILGRTLHFDKYGLPDKITSSFSGSNHSVNGIDKDILAAPVELVTIRNGEKLSWKSTKIKIKEKAEGAVSWSTMLIRPDAKIVINAKMECDGYINYQIELTAQKTISLDDVQLLIPYAKPVATYMMGLGFKGGQRPQHWKWKWDPSQANNMVWIGDVNAGLQCKLKNEFPDWSITNFEKTGPYRDWSNDGLGGCELSDTANSFQFRAFTGRKELSAGQALRLNFGLLITPLKPLDNRHWNERYFQSDPPVENWLSQSVEKGANVINIHQGNVLNPYINYPFLTTDTLTKFVRSAQSRGIRCNIYYTVRELSNHAREIWALRSLGDEIYTTGAGSQIADQFADDGTGGNLYSTGGSWLVEHLNTHYDAAWHTPLPCGDADMSVRTQGLSRLHNYYLEGLAWLTKNTGIRGIYLDGVGYDREIIKRVRKVLDRSADSCLIDFHSGNNFHPTYGLNSPANQYMELFPYLNSLWLGEMYNYNEDPDYWLVEISGIPFGLFGEMLQDCGNAWRGMVYGMTSRLGWLGCDPSALWKVWDHYGMQDAGMIGYWDPNIPVKCNRDDVKVTVYQRTDKLLIAYASWAKEDVRISLNINWNEVKLNSDKVRIEAPEIQHFQQGHDYASLDDILVPVGKGGFIVVEKK